MNENNPLNLIIGLSSQIQQIKKSITKLSQMPELPTLLTGETGTGKELVATVLHQCSPLRDKQMIRLNCSAIPGTLLESTLFGHRRGAFTGANADRAGLVEEADGGVLFLDEIGEIDPGIQSKLLRFLDNGTFRRLGENHERRVHAWIISATNSDSNKSRSHTLRRDIYYRVGSIEIHLPPLRERSEDIRELMDFFLYEIQLKLNRRERFQVVPDIYRIFKKYPWPGNVRELLNVVKRMACFADDGKIVTESLTENFNSILCKISTKTHFLKTLAEIEQEYIMQTLHLTGYQIRMTAKILGVSRNTLKAKLQEYNLDQNKWDWETRMVS